MYIYRARGRYALFLGPNSVRPDVVSLCCQVPWGRVSTKNDTSWDRQDMPRGWSLKKVDTKKLLKSTDLEGSLKNHSKAWSFSWIFLMFIFPPTVSNVFSMTPCWFWPLPAVWVSSFFRVFNEVFHRCAGLKLAPGPGKWCGVPWPESDQLVIYLLLIFNVSYLRLI